MGICLCSPSLRETRPSNSPEWLLPPQLEQRPCRSTSGGYCDRNCRRSRARTAPGCWCICRRRTVSLLVRAPLAPAVRKPPRPGAPYRRLPLRTLPRRWCMTVVGDGMTEALEKYEPVASAKMKDARSTGRSSWLNFLRKKFARHVATPCHAAQLPVYLKII